MWFLGSFNCWLSFLETGNKKSDSLQPPLLLSLAQGEGFLSAGSLPCVSTTQFSTPVTGLPSNRALVAIRNLLFLPFIWVILTSLFPANYKLHSPETCAHRGADGLILRHLRGQRKNSVGFHRFDRKSGEKKGLSPLSRECQARFSMRDRARCRMV